MGEPEAIYLIGGLLVFWVADCLLGPRWRQ